jgi:hypothetical protein
MSSSPEWRRATFFTDTKCFWKILFDRNCHIISVKWLWTEMGSKRPCWASGHTGFLEIWLHHPLPSTTRKNLEKKPKQVIIRWSFRVWSHLPFHKNLWIIAGHSLLEHNFILFLSLSRIKTSTFKFFFGSTKIWTQGLALARQALWYLSHTFKPFCFRLFFR